MKALSFVLLMVFAQSLASFAMTYTVNQDGSGDYLAIQEAIDVAHSGDEILVYPGTYVENIDYLGKDLWVHSASGASMTTIDGSQGPPEAGSCVSFISGEHATAILEGFTLTRGSGTFYAPYGVYWGGGALCWNSACTIRSCRFEDNNADNGAAVFVEAGNLQASSCEFVNNYSRVYGGAVSGELSIINLSGCLIESNVAQGGDGAVSFGPGIQAHVDGCTLRNNQAGAGAGINVGQPDAVCEIVNCVFDGNRATQSHGGGVRVFGATTSIEGCTFWRNSAALDGGGLMTIGSGITTVTGCTFYGNGAGRNGGNIAVWSGAYAVLSTTIQSAAQSGGGIYVNLASASFGCCDSWGNAGGDYSGVPDPTGTGGNISLDPLFCDPVDGDFGLRTDSPCRPFSPPNTECDLIGASPVSCGPPTPIKVLSWGSIKAGFAR